MSIASTFLLMHLQVLMAMLLSGALSACLAGESSWNDDSDDAERSDSFGTDGGGADIPIFASTYSLRLNSQRGVKSRSSGDESTQQVKVNQIVRIEQSGTELMVTVQTCSAVLAKLGDQQPRIDESFLSERVPLSLVRGHLLETANGFRLESEAATIVLGAQLDDRQDDLPSRAGDPRIIDQDEDGEEGISISVLFFQVFAAAKIQLTLGADIVDIDEISGEAGFLIETAIYGDTIPFVDARDLADDEADDLELVWQDHRFAMVAISPDTRCRDL